MQFTPEELICFNSILGGGDLTGIKLPIPPMGDTSAYCERIIHGLTEKGIFDDGSRLTDQGMAIIRCLEEYKKARHKLFLNNLRIGIIDDTYTALIAIQGDHHIPMLQTKENILRLLLHQHPYLCGGQEGRIREAAYCPYEKWRQNMQDTQPGPVLVISTVEEEELTEMKIFYEEEGKGYYYDISSSARYRRGARDMRIELLKLLRINASDKDRLTIPH